MPLPSLDELRQALGRANFLAPDDVNRRAMQLHADLQRLAMPDFRILAPVPVPHPSGETLPLVQYEFGPVRFSIDNARDPNCVARQVHEMDGTGLDCEELLYLSQISEIGHRCAPHLWLDDDELRRDITTPTKHLDTLSEVWWLARWKGLDPTSVEREAKLVRGQKKSVDWRFRVWPDWTIHLENKHLVRAHADRTYRKRPQFYSALRANGKPDKDDPRLKFRPSLPNEINVLGVTWFEEISVELESKVQEFLDTTDRIDAVLLWSAADRRRSGWSRLFPRFRDIAEKRRALAEILLPPTSEDHSRVMMQRFPRPLPDILREAREAGLNS